MVAYIYEGSFLVLDVYISQEVVSSQDADSATLSLLVFFFPINWNQYYKGRNYISDYLQRGLYHL
jgi:hypothetical protein